LIDMGHYLKSKKVRQTVQAKAFTLVEILTVLFVISVAMIGLLALIVQNIQSQNFNKYNLIAYQLAQEGIELVRQVRDSNVNNSLAWDTNLDPGYYYMDYLDITPISTTEAAPETQLYQDSGGFYIHDSGASSTPFYRWLEIERLSGLDYASYVRSTVSWEEHDRSYTYQLETILYDWRE